MTKQEQERLEQMVQSENINDVNLAGALIKEKLNLTDENLKILYHFVELLFNKTMFKTTQTMFKTTQTLTRFELMRQLLNSDVHEPEIQTWQNPGSSNPYLATPFNTTPYTYLTHTTTTGDAIMDSNGTITLKV